MFYLTFWRHDIDVDLQIDMGGGGESIFPGLGTRGILSASQCLVVPCVRDDDDHHQMPTLPHLSNEMKIILGIGTNLGLASGDTCNDP